MANRMIHDPSYVNTTGSSYWDVGSPEASGGWYHETSSSSDSYGYKTFDSQSGWTVGCKFKCTATNPAWIGIFSLFDVATGQIGVQYQGSTGGLRIVGPAQIGDVVYVFTTGVECFIELQTVIHNTAGSAILRVNGETVVDVSGVDTQVSSNASADRFWVSGVRSGYGLWIRNLYVNDNTGGVDDSFWGPVEIITLTSSSDGANTDWTPLSSTNVSNVDDATTDGDTSYNATTSGGAVDTFVMTNADVSGDVLGVEVAISDRLVVASGTARLAPVYRIGSTDYVGSDIVPTTSYLMHSERSRINPDTSSAWTISDLNSMEVGYKRTVE